MIECTLYALSKTCPACKRELPSRYFTYKTRAATSVRVDHKPHYKTSKLCAACRKEDLLRDLTGRKLQNAIMRGEVSFVWGTIQKQKLQALNEKAKAKLHANANASRADHTRKYHALATKLKRKGYSPDAIPAQIRTIRAAQEKTNASRAAQLRAYHAARRLTLTPTPMGE